MPRPTFCISEDETKKEAVKIKQLPAEPGTNSSLFANRVPRKQGGRILDMKSGKERQRKIILLGASALFHCTRT